MAQTMMGRLTSALAGRYTIERELGQGGMATVYLAHDLRHSRKVALKVLRPELAAVIGAERFLQEIRVTAGLQHPHILPLHDSGEADTFLYYVMPFVEGESLRDRLVRERQLAVDEAVRITSEAAAALAYAHGRGVIHRDIKPENILIASGSAVIADFGIARAVTAAGGGRLTETGLSLGTPQYMSPEQATADRELDGRSDVYSLGCVVYEMLTGEPPYTGPTTQSVIAKLLTESPRAVTATRPTVPAHIAAAVHVALARLPADRFRGAAEFAEALHRPGTASLALPGSLAVESPRARQHLMVGIGAGALVGLVAAGLLWSVLRERPQPLPIVRSTLKLDARLQVLGFGIPLALSPDASTLVYASTTQLHVRRLDQLDVVALPGTEQGSQPMFSPDGQQVLFLADGQLKRISLAGGPPTPVCPVQGFLGGTWGPDDTIVFSQGGRLFQVRATGGTPLAVPHDTSQGTLRSPDFLPDGKRVLATIGFAPSTRTVVVDLASGGLTPVAVTGAGARYVDGHLLSFTIDGSGSLTPFDWRSGRTLGPAVPVLGDVDITLQTAGKLGVSKNGWVVYAPRRIERRQLVVVDRSGRGTVITPEQRPFSDPRFSPSGREVAVTMLSPTGGLMGDIWVVDIGQRTQSRLTFDGTFQFPEWSSDGRRVTFANLNSGLFWAATAGGGVDSLFTRAGGVFEGVLSSDQRSVIYRVGAIPGDLYYARRDSLTAVHPLVTTKFDERSAAVSPGDRWLAYVSNETGRDEVYVRDFPGGAGRWLVSTGGGTEPRWRRDGRELFYRNADTLFAVPVLPQSEFAMGSREMLFAAPYVSNPRHASYDVHPDGKRFVFVAGEVRETDEVTLVQNLTKSLHRPR